MAKKVRGKKTKKKEEEFWLIIIAIKVKALKVQKFLWVYFLGNYFNHKEI